MLTIILLVGVIIIVSGLIITQQKNSINLILKKLQKLSGISDQQSVQIAINKFNLRRRTHSRSRFLTLPRRIGLVFLKLLKINIFHQIKRRWKRFYFASLSCFTSLLILTQLLFFTNIAYAAAPICGTPGKDDPVALSGIINTYYPGIAATAASGATSITLGAGKGASTPITAGDLLLVIQMQDASINETDTDAYGDGISGGNASGYTSLRTAGSYQYVVATNSVPISGGTVNLAQALTLTYTNANATSTDGQRRYQVIRVPQYSSATISSTVTSYAWDGSIGGIVAADVAGSLTFSGSGKIDVSGQGFRGGGGTNLGGTTGAAGIANGTASIANSSDYRHTAPSVNGLNTSTAPTGANNYDGSKGEGIAGSPRWTRDGGGTSVTSVKDNGTTNEGYPNGSFGRGAPANAGGGGSDPNKGQNAANTGGGGGANAGAGGKGGDSWTDNAFTAPAADPKRQPVGGYGGTALTPSVNLIFLGGGGGAATSNNSTSGVLPSGGGGGGMVIIRSGQVLGTGTITADGIQGVAPASTDGGGGGGAGGTVLIQSVTPSTPSISISAKGGAGLNSGYNDHGPGGGGGGGYIAYQGFAPTTVVSGAAPGNDLAGTNGSVSNTHLAAADPYGATAGTDGIATSATIPAAQVKPGASCLPLLTVTKTTSTPIIVRPTPVAATATYTITVSNDSTKGDALNVNISDALPTNFTYASTQPSTPVTLTGGATRSTTTNPTAGDTNPTWGTFIIPPSGQVQIVFNATVAAAAALQTYQNPATATYIDPTRTNSAATASSSYNSASSTGEDVTITGVDYGDAPDGSSGTGAGDYQTTLANGGASHNIISTLKIGANTDTDDGTLQNSNADADDTTGTPDDEDGVTLPAINTSTTSYTATVNITNTAVPAYLVGWIDFNKDGVFAVSEGVAYDSNTGLAGIQPIAVSATAQNINIQWTGITGLTVGDTYARFRLSDSATLTTSTPNGAIANGEVEDYKISIGAVPNLSLVKRITAINGTNITTAFVNDSTVNDDAAGWPTNKDKYLRGAIACNSGNACNSIAGVLPGDNLEYTIYFLSSGTDNLKNVKICDRIPTNTTFQADTYAVGKGMILGWNNTALVDPTTSTGTGIVQLTNIADVDQGQFYSAGTSLPDPPCGVSSNTNGGVLVQLGASTIVPKATGSGTPFASYGFVRFNVKVN